MDHGNSSLDRVTIREAAIRLGIKEESVRKRLSRGMLQSDKDESGRVYVYIDSSEDTSAEEDHGKTRYEDESRDELVAAYRDQVDFLRRELERKDAIIMSMSQRIPELEASSSHREQQDASAAQEAPGDQTVSQRPEERPWWSRLFGSGS